MTSKPTYTIFTILTLCLLVGQVSAQAASFPTLVHNSELVIIRGQSTQIGPEILSADASSDTANRIYYTLANAPKYGVLERAGIHLDAGDAFTQADIDAGQVTYQPDQTTNGKDTFDFRLTRGPLVQRVSLRYDGTPVQQVEPWPYYLSSDGHYIVYKTYDNNVVTGDTNNITDIFLRDLDTGETTLVTSGVNGSPSNGESVDGFPSVDGRYVAFWSSASNLTGASTITPNRYHVYRYDNISATVLQVDPYPLDGTARIDSTALGISEDGQVILYQADGNIINGSYGRALYVYDFATGTPEFITSVTDYSYLWGCLSGDGRFVLSNNRLLYDRQTKLGENIPMMRDEYSALSSDGRYVVFVSNEGIVPGDQNEVPDVYVYDRVLKIYEQITFTSDGTATPGKQNGYTPTISGDGRYIAYSTKKVIDQVESYQVMLYDRINRTEHMVSTSAEGQPGNSHSLFLSLSGDGSRLSYYSQATNLVSDGSTEDGIYVRQFPKDIYSFSIAFDNSWHFFMPLVSH